MIKSASLDNPYELARLERIRENNAKLQALGLLRPKETTPPPRKKRRAHNDEDTSIVRVYTTRRSQIKKDEGDLKAEETGQRIVDGEDRAIKYNADNDDDDDDDDDDDNTPTPPVAKKLKMPAPAPAPAPGSTCDFAIDLDDLDERYFAREIGTTKESVVRLWCKQQQPTNRAVPRFNKYAGALEWRNCVFLFINMDNPGFDNSFLHKNKSSSTVRWFSSNKSKRAVERMKREKDLRILLFVRKQSGTAGPTSSYVYLGALTLLQYIVDDADADVVEFRFEIQRMDKKWIDLLS